MAGQPFANSLRELDADLAAQLTDESLVVVSVGLGTVELGERLNPIVTNDAVSTQTHQLSAVDEVTVRQRRFESDHIDVGTEDHVGESEVDGVRCDLSGTLLAGIRHEDVEKTVISAAVERHDDCPLERRLVERATRVTEVMRRTKHLLVGLYPSVVKHLLPDTVRTPVDHVDIGAGA